MTLQTVPAYLQNASHSAAVFRQAISAAWSSPGVVAPGELALAAQSSPNMSIRVGAGRAVVPGSQVSAPTLLSGAAAAFTTQANYQVLNDATVSLTISTSDPTNPRIDTVYTAVQDAFYSGATNTAVLGVVTGVPAASPVASAAPNNAVVLGYVAVAANATSIVSGNVTSSALPAITAGTPPVTITLLTGSYANAATITTVTFPAFPIATLIDLEVDATTGNGTGAATPIGIDLAATAGTLSKFYNGTNNPNVLSGLRAALARSGLLTLPANTAATVTLSLLTTGATGIIEGRFKTTRRFQ